jgi:long-chain acyl-CoA synthetase
MGLSALSGMLGRFPAARPALVDEQGELSATALLGACRVEQQWLERRGAARVALLAGNHRGWVISDLALRATGLVTVPLPAHFSDAQLRHALVAASIDAVATDLPGRIRALDLGFVPQGRSPASALDWLVRPLADAPAALPPGTHRITFTSGSTGEPKGVCLTRTAEDAVAASVAAVAATLGVERHLALLPLATLLENVAGLYASWRAGATCVLSATTSAAIASGTLDPAAFTAAIRAAAASSMILVPELLRIVVSAVESGWVPPHAGRFHAVGGARVGEDLLARSAAARLPVYQGYGLSECTSVTCLNTPEANRRGSVGQALPHARVRRLDSGELVVGGTLMAGYLGATNTMMGDTFPTGDLGEIDEDGYVYVKGRIKNVFINSLGRNITPEWIESEIGQEPGIGQIVVFGEARPDVVALIVPARAGFAPAAIAKAVARGNARLPAYARVARYALLGEPFSVGNGLLTGNGRPRRERIAAHHARELQLLHGEQRDTVVS